MTQPMPRLSHRRHRARVAGWIACLGAITALAGLTLAAPAAEEARPPANDQELKSWLQNMVWHHRFSLEEIEAATGLDPDAIQAALDRFDISQATRPAREPDAPLLALPYPGGRHPRLGFLEGAIRPQRDTKVSVFTPWDPDSYVVVDLPEAIWSNLGLTYLAHTHIDTLWTLQGKTLKRVEWRRLPDGSLTTRRVLPNDISFGARVKPAPDAVRMELWLKNGTPRRLTDLRVQNCVMLKEADGFAAQTMKNKLVQDPFVATRSEDGNRWIITAWLPCHRPWANPPVPCMHSDPKIPDCPPGQTRRVRGWLSFYEGSNIDDEFRRILRDPWLKHR